MTQFVRNLAEKAPALVSAAVTYSKPRVATFWHYAKVELVPPTPAEIPTAIQNLKKIINSAQTGSFKQLTVKESSSICMRGEDTGQTAAPKTGETYE
uniref:ATP synthase subunit g, mitochondrial n=1 Tax=Balaenoptera musculus TaxID=9771 RepID=A0A8C0CCH6_BALMU